MKNAIIVHCWEGVPDYCWYPYVKTELEALGVDVQVPAMPETEMPKQSLWVPKLASLIEGPLDDIVLIGHSVGCITILRYLEALKPGQKIAGAVLVAGFTDNLGFDEIDNYFQSPIDFEKVKSHCPKFIAIHSDNDPFVPMKHAEIFEEKLGAEVVTMHEMGHFSGAVDDEEACLQLPEVVDAVKQITHKE